ncbi:helix-turn-helix domain-containing protein [Sphingobium bisphenolivorans]|uniref:helix-turn-helix domain-containing protein n=1 Tax=Sphingobium bisphenolivorans TaxID=1335760 RepID=UPI00048A183C|nr:helix-turn-helix domain-containing protein [Sphingobium bisphenolivorans]
MSSIAPTNAVPNFYLYGEPQRSVAEGFVHVESLDDRSRPSEWTIQPHIHRDLNHIILIAQGGGSMRAEGQTAHFRAPCLLLIPATVVHGFSWASESRGWVATMAENYLHHLLERDPDLARLFRSARAVPLPPEDGAPIERRMEQLAQELGWSHAGQRAMVEALLLSIMVQALRRSTLSDTQPVGGRRHAALVARLRERVEQRFREREPVAMYARALGVSESALRQACARIAARSPAAILDERALLEARRLLLYSNMSVSEIAFALGFDDPAYFSRFFARHAGKSPRAWRTERSDDAGT